MVSFPSGEGETQKRYRWTTICKVYNDSPASNLLLHEPRDLPADVVQKYIFTYHLQYNFAYIYIALSFKYANGCIDSLMNMFHFIIWD